MSSIYRYQGNIKRSSLDLHNEKGEAASTDVCEIDGWRYVSVADDAIPDPDVVIDPVKITPSLRSAIKHASPHCRMIKSRAWDMIRREWPEEDQRALDRKMAAAGAGVISLSAAEKKVLKKYKDSNDAAMQWAAEQYAELGL